MKEDKMPKSRAFGIYKKEEYEAFKLWLSLPRYIRGTPRNVLISRHRIKDEKSLLIMPIRTQQEFARVFGIKDLGTLTDWKKKIKEGGDLEPWHSEKYWRAFSDLVGVLYVNCILYGKVRDIKLYLELVEDWKGPGRTREEIESPITNLTEEEKAELDTLLATSRL